MRRALEIIARLFTVSLQLLLEISQFREDWWVGRQVENRFMACIGWAGSATGNEKGFSCEGQWIGKAMQGITVLRDYSDFGINYHTHLFWASGSH